MKLLKREIEHIANLARLELTEEELKKYGEQLSGILNYIDQLKEVDTAGIEPTAHITGMENVFREDKEKNWAENEIEASLKDAPGKEGKFIKVRRVLE